MILYNKYMVNFCPLHEGEEAIRAFTSDKDKPAPVRCPGLGFPFPLFVAALQFGLHFIIGAVLIHVFKIIPFPSVTRRDIILTSAQGALVGLSVGLANMSFLYLEASFFEEIRQLATVFTLLISFISGVEKPSLKLFGTILMIAGGVGIAVAGEQHIDGQYTGVVWVAVSCLITAGSNVLVQVLLQHRPHNVSIADYHSILPEVDFTDDDDVENNYNDIRYNQLRHIHNHTKHINRTGTGSASASLSASALTRVSSLTVSEDTSLLQLVEESGSSDTCYPRLAADEAKNGKNNNNRDNLDEMSNLDILCPSNTATSTNERISLTFSADAVSSPIMSAHAPSGNAISATVIPGIAITTGAAAAAGVGVSASHRIEERKEVSAGDAPVAGPCAEMTLVRDAGKRGSPRRIPASASMSMSMSASASDAPVYMASQSLSNSNTASSASLAVNANTNTLVPAPAPASSSTRMHPVLVLYLHSPASFLVLIPFIAYLETPYISATPLWVDSVYTWRIMLAIAFGGIIAFVLQWVHYKLTALTSAVTLCVVGTCKTIVVLISGVIMFRNHLSLLNISGFGVCFVGLLMYAWLKADKINDLSHK